MLRKLMTVVAVIAFAESKATHVQYPATAPCILLDIELNNTLTRNGKESSPTYSFDGTTVLGGKCVGITKHAVILRWTVDNATVQIDFVNDTGSVSMELAFMFVPFKVWGNGSTEMVILSSKLDLGSTDKAFMCLTSETVHFNATKDTTDALYEADWKVLNIHAQAFGVKNGDFSKDAEHCAADQKTTEPTTETTEKTKPTTENDTTEPTTEPKKITTEPMTTAPVTTVIPPANHPQNTFTFINTGAKGGYCVRMQAQVLFKIIYPGGSKPAEIDIPDEIKYPVTVTGDCNYNRTGLNMMRFRDTWSVQFVFSNSKVKSEMLGADDSNAFWWKDVTLNYTYDDQLFPGLWKNLTAKSETVYTNFTGKQFVADIGGSYMCNSDETLKLSDNVKMETWELQYFAFENRIDFSEDNVSQCADDKEANTVVTIIIPTCAALAGLLVVVLIAYLIGRRRNRKGYENMTAVPTDRKTRYDKASFFFESARVWNSLPNEMRKTENFK